MKFRFVRVIGIVAMCFFGIQLTMAQSYHQLNARDFEGVPRFNKRGVVAYTNCTIDFHYQANRENGYYKLNFNVQLIMNRSKSWIDRSRIRSGEELNEILKHEQGHYTIAYLEQQELIRVMEQTRFGADYQSRVSNIFNQIDAKYKQLNYDYDEDTANMQNRVQQNSWDQYFTKRLEFMPDEA